MRIEDRVNDVKTVLGMWSLKFTVLTMGRNVFIQRV